MSLTLNALKRIAKIHEGQTLEFKENLSKEIKKEICAFANSQGGKIYLGITDSEELKSQNITNTYLSQLDDFISQLTPKLDSITYEIIENNFVVVDVPEGELRNKPYSIDNKFYIRKGASSQTLTREEIKFYFQEGRELAFDERVHQKFSFEKGFDTHAYELFCQKSRIDEKEFDKKQLLENLKITRDGRFTNAGVLLFAKNITDFFIDFQIRCAIFKGKTKANIIDSKEFNSNLIENIEGTLIFFKRNLRNKFVIEGLQRREELEIPEEVLREALLNAICHRDYNIINAIHIYVFDDRIEIVSPGGLVKELSIENMRSKSISRNPFLFLY